jgi:TPR repeat protein
MSAVGRLLGLASPAAALRRGVKLAEQGKAAEAFPLLAAAAKAGIPEAEFRVARCYLDGAGVPVSRVEATRWLERAAGHDWAEAQWLLAALYVNGLAMAGAAEALLAESATAGDPDFAAALAWARRAAPARLAPGQALLGYLLTPSLL